MAYGKRNKMSRLSPGRGRNLVRPKYDKFRGRDFDIRTSQVADGHEIVQEIIEPSIKDLYQNIEIQFGDESEWKTSTKTFFALDTAAPNDEMMTQKDTLISHEAYMHDWNEFVIASGRVCLNAEAAPKVLDTKITELESTVPKTPMLPPTIDMMQIRNVDCLNSENTDMLESLPPNCFKKAGYTMLANWNLLVVANAYNYIPYGEEEPNREDIQYVWRFTSGAENYDVNVIGKVVSNTRELNVENMQRKDIGTYTLEVKNTHGVTYAKSFDLFVRRPGEVREVKMTVGEQEILTGQYTWNEVSSDHDENHTMFDNKWQYDYENEEFVSVYYRQTVNKWYTDKHNQSYEWYGSNPG